MAEPKNKQEFVELEYCFEKYFNDNFAPIVKSESELFRQNAEHETQHRDDGGWSGYIDAASPFSLTFHQQTSGEWNRKTTEDLLKSCNEKFFSDPKVSEDIRNMTIALQSALVGELGKEKYIELSKGVPGGNLASFYVCNRFQNLFVEQLARQKVPRSSYEFIMSKGIGESLPGFLVSSQMKTSELDEEVKTLAEKYYGASGLEHIAAFGLSFVLDSAISGGYGTVGKAATWLAVDGGLRMLGNVLPKDVKFDEMFGEAVWGDVNAVARLRAAGRSGDLQKTERLDLLNGLLNKHLYLPSVDVQGYQQVAQTLREQLRGLYPDFDGMSNGIGSVLDAAGIQVNEGGSYPAWMDDLNEEERFNSAVNWTALAVEAKIKGVKQWKSGDKMFTIEELAQKGYDYSCSLDTSANRSKSHQVVSQATAQQQGAPQQDDGTAVAPNSTKAVGGWGGMLDQLGLSGFGTVGKNLGYVLAMLPDVLIGMFTGKSRNLKFGDNLLPIGAIIAGMFVKNPLLKMLLVGFGGANLLNKAGQEILENRDGQRQPVRSYREYGDEVLHMRIRHPAMRGNTLVAAIDGVPSVITINDEVVDAFEKGKIPLNTLANAVLRKYDEQKNTMEASYVRQVSQDDAVERSRGLK